MRALHVLASVDDPDAGPSYSVPALCRGLSAHGAQAEIHTVAGWRAFGPGPDGVGVVRHPQDLAAVPLAARLCLSSSLRRALEAEAPHCEIIHGHGLWLAPNIYPVRAVARTKARFVLSPRGMLGEAALGFSALPKKVLWSVLQGPAARAAHCLHATALSEYEEVRRAGLENPVAMIPNGVDLPKAPARPGGGRPRTLLSLGRIHPKKGLPDLLNAWAAAGEATAQWRLRLVGPDEGGHAAELARQAQSLGLSNVEIEGAMHGDAKAAAFAQSSLFVLPSLNENFAMTVAEALAAGIPVIASRGSPWAGLEANGCGWWVETGPEPLAAALRVALAAPDDVLADMGARGRAWMQESFSWKRRAGEMLEVYKWLQVGGMAPACVRLD
jgi:glycosyltransferase involved in cell wall biosynthesis